jgi:membrane protein DedA with SNARE-associated domain
MMKVFDLVVGSAICLFGLLIGYLFLSSLDPHNLAISKKLVIGVVVPGAIILIGLKRVFKKRSPAPPG